MTDERHEIWKVADAIQMDLRAAQAKLTELRTQLAGLALPSPSEVTCPECGLRARGPNTLAEHVYHAHGGPLPAHWARADELAGERT